MNFYWLWLKRVLFSPQIIFQTSFLFSLFGLVLAVASLTVALLAINGFSSSLERILIGKQGHLRLQAKEPISKREILRDIEPYKNFISDQALFLSFQALIAKNSSFKGVFFEAIQDEKLKDISFLKNRLLEGNLESSEPFAVLGSALAEELKLSAGSSLSIIVAQRGEEGFSRKQARFKAGAIADFGRHKLNSSFAVAPLSAAKKLGMERVSGLSLWLKSRSQIPVLKRRLESDLDELYFVRSWKDMDSAFFEMIDSDKKIIFFVLMILIVSAGFNVSSSLFVQVFRKTKDISILKALGAKQSLIRNIFLLNGLVLGLTGAAGGIVLGLAAARALIFIQNRWPFIPQEVYQLNEFLWDWKSLDIFLIFIASLIITLLSSLWPARRAYKMSVKAGLSYD